ncbi:trypsin-2-like [Harmonia axyridis]|uniref:trypsin-2-like n=1 Tax=Harmonia axyridis TaxID=115357 RepID=UPI001E275814|nr:trypsin-2-like [Harmonia axyridis]
MDIKTFITRTFMALVILFSTFCPSAELRGDTQSSIFKKREKRRNQLEHIMDFRIVGGTEASIKDFPYMVSLQVNSNHFCGGSIVTKSFVLTAAHCVVKAREGEDSWIVGDPLLLNVVAGQTVLDLGECQFRDVKKIHVHSKFNFTSVRNDIALLEIFGHFEMNKYTQVAQIASKVHPKFETYDFCTAIGWGIMEPVETDLKKAISDRNILQQVDLHPSLHSTCEKFFAAAPYLYDRSKLCIIVSEEKDACLGDSGGPFICNGIQYGIISFGLGCAQMNMPGVFTNVSTFHDWIYAVINNTETQVVTRMVEVENLTNASFFMETRISQESKNCQVNLKCFFFLRNFIILCLAMFMSKFFPRIFHVLQHDILYFI